MNNKEIMKLIGKKSAAERKEYILYILSWMRAGHFAFDRHFEAWLKKHALKDDEIEEVMKLAYSYDEDLGPSAVHFGTIYDEDRGWVNDPAKTNKEVEKMSGFGYNQKKKE